MTAYTAMPILFTLSADDRRRSGRPTGGGCARKVIPTRLQDVTRAMHGLLRDRRGQTGSLAGRSRAEEATLGQLRASSPAMTRWSPGWVQTRLQRRGELR